MAKAKRKIDKKQVERVSVGVLFGDIVSSRFFNRNKFSFFILVALVIFYTSIKYECQTRMETIKSLEQELAIVKSESIRQQSRYMSRTRESMMQALVDSIQLDLGIQEEPPYRLHYDEKD